MSKKIRLKPFKIKYDKQVKMWVAQDVNTGYASQGETKERATENLIDALRLVILTYQDIKEPSKPLCEEWIKEKAGDFVVRFARCIYGTQLEVVKDFIRSLLKEAPTGKPKVSREFVEKWADKFDAFVQKNPGLIIDIDWLQQMFEEAGISIEEK